MKAPLLYTVAMTILILLIYLIHYHMIQREVRRTSRCLRLKDRHSAGGVYTLDALNENSDRLYNITYDLTAKTSTIDCACPAGNVVNHFKQIPYYDMKEQQTRLVDDKMCSCDSLYDDPRDQVFFEGAPGLVRYMQNVDDVSFFVSDPTYSSRSRPSKSVAQVTAYATKGGIDIALYKVTYNIDDMLAGKTTFHNISCVGPKGTVENTFIIPVYRNVTGTQVTRDTHKCTLDAQYMVSKYEGTPGLVTFMGATNPAAAASKAFFTNIIPT